MADKQAKPGQEEPSIEEILGSIRRIIAEDEEEPSAEGAAAPAAEKQPDPMEEEPLELTEKIDPDGNITDTAAPATEEDTKLAFVEEAPPAPEPVPEPAPEPEPAPAPAPPPPAQEEPKMADEILSDATADAAAEAMAKLARHTPITDEGHDGISIESIVREMLRPMLKEWMDKNLPDLVQKMVERELERLSKRL